MAVFQCKYVSILGIGYSLRLRETQLYGYYILHCGQVMFLEIIFNPRMDI